MKPLKHAEPSYADPLPMKGEGDQGLLVISKEGKVLSANPLAEVLLSSSLSPGLSIRSDCALAKELSRSESPLAKTLKHGEPGTGIFLDEEIPEDKIFYRSIPLFKGYDQIVGAVISIFELHDAKASHGLKFLGLSHEDIMDNLTEGVFVVNTRWQITCFNQTAKVITGYMPEEVLGKFCWEVFRTNHCKKSVLFR